MSLRKLARNFALLAWVPFVLTTCGGAAFDDPSRIKGLRVLAVQKSSPYPKPGEQVKLKLLFWDGKSSEDSPRDIFVLISPIPCENPKGDLYFNCLTDLGGMPDGGAPDVPDGGLPRLEPSRFIRAEAAPRFQDINNIREATVGISPTIVQDRAPGVTPYGLAYVLFMACAGTPKQVPNAGPNTLPIGCFDADDRQLGADDFVIGYTSMYVYNERVNNNPVIDDLVFGDVPLAGSTTDPARVHHVPSCKESDRANCPKYVLTPSINRELTVEKDDDPTARTPDGQQLEEQAWINYYITAGELKSSVRLVNDATRGWNDQHAAEYTAPAEPGPVRLFAIVHDNRGGVAWAEGKIFVD